MLSRVPSRRCSWHALPGAAVSNSVDIVDAPPLAQARAARGSAGGDMSHRVMITYYIDVYYSIIESRAPGR
jgi:hypothetical protein